MRTLHRLSATIEAEHPLPTEDGAVIVNRVTETGDGFNAATLQFGDLIADGVIDPVKVTRSAVVNAASVARMVLTTETAVTDRPAEADAHAGHGHAH